MRNFKFEGIPLAVVLVSSKVQLSLSNITGFSAKDRVVIKNKYIIVRKAVSSEMCEFLYNYLLFKKLINSYSFIVLFNFFV